MLAVVPHRGMCDQALFSCEPLEMAGHDQGRYKIWKKKRKRCRPPQHIHTEYEESVSSRAV